MRDDTIPQTVLFPDLFNKPLVATFDQPDASADGGAVLLKAAEARSGLIDGFARCLVDDRQSGKVRHTLTDMLAQRIFGLACGYPDANDASRLADDSWVGRSSPVRRWRPSAKRLDNGYACMAADRPPAAGT